MRTDYYINPLPAVVPQINGGTGLYLCTRF